MARQTLEAWIRQTINDSEKGKCTAISLVHMKGNIEKEIHSIQLGVRQWDLKNLADTFKGRAEAYAEDLPGSQMFQLLGFYDSSKEPMAFKPFRVAGNTDHEGLGTEAPTSQGMVQQSMRHSEALMAMFTRQTGTLFESSNRAIELLTKRNVELTEETRESFTIIKELLMQQLDKRHEHRMKELEYERTSHERRSLLSAAPALINSLTGKDVFPQSNADSALVDMLIEHLANQPEQETINMLSTLKLPPTIMGALAGRFERHLKAKQLEAHARQANGADPEEDASGGSIQ